MRTLFATALALLVACGGKGPMFIRDPQVKNCACEKCVCSHCMKRDEGAALCYCGDKTPKGERACACGTSKDRTCRCDHCVGYPQGQCGCAKEEKK